MRLRASFRPARRLAPAAALAAGLIAGFGCSNPSRPLYITVERYLSAVQQHDDDFLALLWAPHRREYASLTPEEQPRLFQAFRDRLRDANRMFDRAKQEGSLPPDPLGVAMFRALGLGKGAVSLPVSAIIGEGDGAARVRTRVVTNLETLHLDSLPDGVRIYLMGYPLGRLEMITVGFDSPKNHHLLDSVDIDWTLSRTPAGMRSPAGWLIESIAADPGSAVEWHPRPGREG